MEVAKRNERKRSCAALEEAQKSVGVWREVRRRIPQEYRVGLGLAGVLW